MHREVDLVIKNESEMNMLVKYLILKMQTLDGNKNSAAKLTDLMNQKCMQQNPKNEPS